MVPAFWFEFMKEGTLRATPVATALVRLAGRKCETRSGNYTKRMEKLQPSLFAAALLLRLQLTHSP